jgi:predicted DsbA family dithiol-disulfide isomerase
VLREPGATTACFTPHRIHSSTSVAQKVAVIAELLVIPSIVAPMRVEIFSDVVCPWCYIGKRRLDTAVANLRARGVEIDLDISYKPYQLDPTAPIGQSTPVAEAYAKKFGGAEKAQQILAHVTNIASQDGIVFNMDIALRANTLMAHRLLVMAQRDFGNELQAQLKERIMQSYFTDGDDIADHVVLSMCASEVGIPQNTATQFLLSDQCVDDVQESLQMAAENGITAVPTFIFNDQWSVPGAQDVEMFERVIQRLNERTAS